MFAQDVLLQSNPEEMPLGSAQQGELTPAACAALTASSALHTLRLQHAELPEGAWLHMFPAGRTMPVLRQLHLQDTTQPLSDTDFELLVRCARGLTSLTLSRVLHSRVSLEPLLQLTGLKELELRHLHGDSGARVFAQLTCLRRLHNDDSNLSPAGLMRLTALKQLTHLHMHYSAESGSIPLPVKLSNQVSVQFVCLFVQRKEPTCRTSSCATCAQFALLWQECLQHIACVQACPATACGVKAVCAAKCRTHHALLRATSCCAGARVVYTRCLEPAGADVEQLGDVLRRGMHAVSHQLSPSDVFVDSNFMVSCSCCCSSALHVM